MDKRIRVLLVAAFCAALAGAVFSSGGTARETQAGELQPEFPHAIMIEEKLCTALVIALGHQNSTTAALKCLDLKSPTAMLAVAGFMAMSDGVDDPIVIPDIGNPGLTIRIDQPCVEDTNEDDELCNSGDVGVDDEVEVASQIDARDDGRIDNKYKLYASDFATIDLDANQLHQVDGKLWVLVFSDNDNPARFRPSVGAMRVDTVQPGSFDFTCGSFLVDNVSSFEEDCDGDGERGDGVKPAQLFPGPTAIDRGDGIMRITEPHRETYIDYTVVGELASISFTLLKTAAQENTPDGECSFPLSVAGVTDALANLNLAVVLVHAEDTDGTQIASALLDWTIEDLDAPENQQEGDEALEKAFPFLATTPTVDLGSFGKGFPQAICGGSKGPGTVKVIARTSALAASLDPGGARVVGDSFEVTIVGEPDAITEITSTPPIATCDGTSSVELSVKVVDEAGNNVVNNNLVTFDTQVLGTANPITAKTTDGVAKTTITPLANSSTGVPVTIFATDQTSSFLVQCGPGSGIDAAGAPGGGAAAGGGTPRGGISGPDTGTAGTPRGEPLSWWPALALVLAAASLGAARWSFNRR